jgi:hypothetical protein
LKNLQTASQQTEHEPTFPLAALGQPPKLARGEEDIPEYLDRFTRYLQLSNVPMSVRASLPALHLPPDVYKTTKGLVAPQLIESIPYSELSSILRQHYTPKCLVIAESFFPPTSSNGGESVRQFICELRKLAAERNFGTCLDRALRDKFVVGLRSQEMVKRLLIEEDISTYVAVEICKSTEAAQSTVVAKFFDRWRS